MPISKRINNLSITSNNLYHSQESNDSNGFIHHNYQQQQPHHHHPLHQQHDQYPNHLSNSIGNDNVQQNNSYFNMFSVNGERQSTILEHPHSHQQQSNHTPNTNSAIDVTNYSPELSAEENPFYYNKNKLLFDLHVERERRSQK